MSLVIVAVMVFSTVLVLSMTWVLTQTEVNVVGWTTVLSCVLVTVMKSVMTSVTVAVWIIVILSVTVAVFVSSTVLVCKTSRQHARFISMKPEELTLSITFVLTQTEVYVVGCTIVLSCVRVTKSVWVVATVCVAVSV